MKPLPSLALAAALLSSPFAMADEPDADRVGAARVLAETLGLTDQMEAGVMAMKPMVDEQADALGLEGDDRIELMEIYRAWFRFDFDHKKLEEEIIQLYATEFTAEELLELNAFYLTPLGKKTLEKLPLLMQKGAVLGAAEGKRAESKLLERITPFLERVEKAKEEE